MTASLQCVPLLPRSASALAKADARRTQGGLVLDAGTGNGKYLGCRSVLAWDGKAADSLPRPLKGKGRALEPDDAAHGDEHRSPRSDLLPVGFDMSAGLLGIASAKGHEVVRGDCVDLSCWRRGAFVRPLVLSLSLPPRRFTLTKPRHTLAEPRHLDRDHPPLCDARSPCRVRQGASAQHIPSLQSSATSTSARNCRGPRKPPDARFPPQQMILAVLHPSPPTSSSASSPSGPLAPAPLPAQLLIVVWSVEQDPALAARGGDRSARRTTGGKKGAVPVEAPLDDAPESTAGPGSAVDGARGEGQDVLVPWERQAQVPRKREKGAPRERRPKGARAQPSASAEVEQASSSPAQSALEPTLGPTLAADDAPLDSPSSISPPPAAAADPKPTFNRYYHLFQQYELSALVARAAQQLGLALSAPAGYALDEGAHEDGSGEAAEREDGASREGRAVSGEVDGWEAFVELEEERWERENWVVEVAVGWRRLDNGAARGGP